MRDVLHCVILSRRDTAEYDRLYTLYSRQQGKLFVRAKGVRKATSKLAPFLLSFVPLHCEVIQGSSSPILVGCEIDREVAMSVSWEEDICNIAFNEACSEFMNVVIREYDSDEELFAWLHQTIVLLRTLWQQDPVRFSLLRPLLLYAFLGRLSAILGYGLELQQCVSCNRVFSERDRSFNVSEALGGVLCEQCLGSSAHRFSQDEIKLLRLIIAGRFSILFQLRPSLEWSRVRRFLDSYFRTLSEHPLTTIHQFWEYERKR